MYYDSKTHGRTDEESKWQNSRKIPSTFLDIASCKLVLLAHLTIFNFSFPSTTLSLSFFSFLLELVYLLSVRSAFPYSAFPQYRRPPKQQEHSPHSGPTNILAQHHSQKFLQRFPPKTCFGSAAFTQPVRKHLHNKTVRTPPIFDLCKQ